MSRFCMWEARISQVYGLSVYWIAGSSSDSSHHSNTNTVEEFRALGVGPLARLPNLGFRV